MPTGSRPGRRKTVAPCWCGGAPGGAPEDLTPAPFNVRTRVHEYGGGAYAVRGGIVVAANFADQRLWRLHGGGRTTPLTPESGARLRYADLELDPAGNRLFAVREDHRGGGEPVNSIVAIGLDGADDAGSEVALGHDFFSSPRLSPDRRRLAWLSWDHPDMPWDSDRAVAGGDRGERADRSGAAGRGRGRGGDRPAGLVARRASSTSSPTEPAGGTSIGWAPTDRCPSAPCLPNSPGRPGPSAGAGTASSAPTSSSPATLRMVAGIWRPSRSPPGALSRLDLPYTAWSGVGIADGRAVLRAGAPDRPAAIVLLEPASGTLSELARAGDLPVDPAYLAAPQPIEFPTEPGRTAHAFYYPPTNPDHRRPPGERPPLIVMSHGGPTGSTSSELRPRHPVLDQARLRGVRRQLRRQHRLRPRLPRAPQRALGRGRRRRLRQRRALPGRRAAGPTRAASPSPAAAPAATPRSAR